MSTTTSQPIPCPQVIVPTADDLEQIIISIGNTFGWEYIKPIEDILGAFPLSHSWNKELDIPELEWEGKIQCCIEEFKLFPVIKIAEFLQVPLVVPIPILDISIDCKRLMSDPSYKTEILKQIEAKGAPVLDLFLSKTTKENWDGTDGVDSPDIKLSEAWKEICEKIQKYLQSGGVAAMSDIIGKSPVDEIIELLEETLPEQVSFFLGLLKSIPAGGYEFDVDGLFQSLKKQAEEEGVAFQELILNFEIPFVSDVPDFLGLSEVLPKTLGDLIDLDKTREVKNIDMPNWEIQKLYEKFRTFIKDLPQILLESVLSILSKLIEFLIPPEIPLPFTFCTFLSIIGFPKEISVSSLTS